MSKLIQRLHRLKMILAGVTLTVTGVAFVALSQILDSGFGWPWLAAIPWTELGGVLIGAGVLGIWIDYLFQREQQELTDQRLRTILADHAPAMRDAVLDGFAANNVDLARVATPGTLDAIITNSLALRLDDTQFATEVFSDLRHQAIEATERWHDLDISITLTPLRAKRGQADYFEVTVRHEYTVIPKHPQRRFVCLSDRDEYDELSRTYGETSAWYFKPDDRYDANQREAYEVLQFSVNGEDRTIRRSTRKSYQAYTANVGADLVDAGEEAVISYTYRTVTQQSGHLLFFDIEQPTRDLSVTLDHTSVDLASVSTIDLFPGVRPSRIETSPEGASPKTVRYEIDGWVFPRAGIAFVWTTSGEL